MPRIVPSRVILLGRLRLSFGGRLRLKKIDSGAGLWCRVQPPSGAFMLPKPFDRFHLTNRTALVTGARREIGRAIALALAGAGARLAIHHAGTDEEAADADTVVREIEHGGGAARAFGQDFTEDDAGHRLAARVAAWSPVDILVLNASIELPEPYQAITRRRFDKQVSVNLRSPLELLQTLVPAMGDRGWGRVVTIGSVQQVRPHPQMMVYAGTKAAQLNWAWNLARQFGGQGVTVNNLAPGAILTARNRAQMATEGEALVQRIPAGRLGRPDDLAGAALLLCSDAGAYINGVNLYVDGGRSIA
jgi:NAD(P)-dependent dehydrogenase (short-subunit alcohol dehydrogenase family)